MKIHTIYGLQRYVWSYELPKLPIRGLGQIYEHVLEALPSFSDSFIIYWIISVIQQNFDMEDDDFYFSSHISPYLEK